MSLNITTLEERLRAVFADEQSRMCSNDTQGGRLPKALPP